MEETDKVFLNKDALKKWNSYYRRLERFCERRSTSPIPMDEELVRWVENQGKIRHLLPKELDDKLSALDYDFGTSDNSWDGMHRQLLKFVQKHGHSFVPADPEYEELRDWLIRQVINKSLLSEAQVEKLDSLNVDWNMAISRDHRWELMFQRLKDYREKYGDCRVPQKWHKDPQLALWVQVQRRMYHQGKLRKDREEKLKSVDFIWSIQTLFDSQWQEYFEELKAFCQKHGHCRVPGKQEKLAAWVERQRTAKTRNQLPAKRVKMLNSINFIWGFDEIKKKEWEKKFKELQAFQQKHGHGFVPVNYKENKSLGTWVATQRKLEATGKLESYKKRKLDALGFVWSRDTQKELEAINAKKWEASFKKLKAYKKEHGTCQVSLKIDPVLQRWTCWQRKAFYEGKLPQDRLDKLNELRFPWSIQEGYWMKMYDALIKFKKEFGHTRVPFQWPRNHKLADWVYRTKVNKSALSVQKVELLNEIGFDWTLTRRNVVPWKDMYSRLLAFHRKHGHTRVPVKWEEDPKLGKWVSRMRSEREKLEPRRVALLEAIEFDWGFKFSPRNENRAKPEFVQQT